MTVKFEIEKSSDGKYFFTLKAQFNEIIFTSEMYTTKQNCKDEIESIKKYAPSALIDDTWE